MQTTSRDNRVKELSRMSKARLIAIYQPHCLWSAHPLATWGKDELISSILSLEYPPAPEPQP
jgi:hypothetical protein